jgi:hypothetical protein
MPCETRVNALRTRVHALRARVHALRSASQRTADASPCTASASQRTSVGYPIPCPLMGQGATQVALGVQFDMPARFDEERGVGLKDEGGSGDALAWA